MTAKSDGNRKCDGTMDCIGLGDFSQCKTVWTSGLILLPSDFLAVSSCYNVRVKISHVSLRECII